jgi:hypothetical protein
MEIVEDIHKVDWVNANVYRIIARMLVPRFVCDISRTSLFIVGSIREAHNSTLPHIKKGI